MTIAEVQAVVENYNISYQNQWNQTRFLGFINACIAGSKLKKPQDLITFTWEIDEQQQQELEVEDIEVTKSKLLQVLELI